MPRALSPPRPPATVVVCTRGRGEMVTRCVASVAADLGAGDELVVVEAETESAREVVAGLGDPRCRWLLAPEPGRSRQLNQGILAANGEVVLVTDDDCVVVTGWVDAMAAAFSEPDVGVAFGPVDGVSAVPGSEPIAWLPAGPAPPHMWAFSHGAAMAVRRSAVLQVGGFDERFGPGATVHGEEADVLLRMREAGWRCWAAGAPAVLHMPWRTDDEEVRNALVYERGGGAWVGAAMRRHPGAAAGAIATRLRYQLGHFRSSPSAGFAIRAQAAFVSGVATGLRMGPQRFLNAEPATGPGVASPPGHAPHGARGWSAAERRLPWPAVRDRRCLSIDDGEAQIASALRRRGAAEVVELAPGGLGRLSDRDLGTFDAVVACDLLRCIGDAPDLLGAVNDVCGSHLLSIERLDVSSSVVARRRPVVRPAPPNDGACWTLNGAAHRELLAHGGFAVAFASAPWRMHGGIYRALLARPGRPEPVQARPSAER